MDMKNKKTIEYYLNLPWTYTIKTAKEEEKVIYILCVNELSGICTDAETINEAMELIKDAMKGLFELYLENGEEIPEPIDQEKYKGNIAYRTTSRRHYKVAREAQRKNASLSKVIDECIDNSLGKKQ